MRFISRRGLFLFGAGIGTLWTTDRYSPDSLSNFTIIRFGRAFSTAFVTVIDYKIAYKFTLDAQLDEEVYKQKLSELHQRGADRILNLCLRNRGLFIKFGQVLSSLYHLVPPEYIQTLRVMQDSAPKSSLKELLSVLEEDLGHKADDIFEWFDKEPIAAASLAQVHRARLHDGTSVAVKIQHPNVKKRGMADLEMLRLFTKTVKRIFPEFPLARVAQQARLKIPMELDFISEAEHGEKVSEMLSDLNFVKIPRVYKDIY
ncbi:hypothetical protein ACOME3_001587 [Neoechinorhynchus agilis]